MLHQHFVDCSAFLNNTWYLPGMRRRLPICNATGCLLCLASWPHLGSNKSSLCTSPLARFLNLLAQGGLHVQARNFGLFACLAESVCVMTTLAALQMPVTLGLLACLLPSLWDQQPSMTASATWPTLAAASTWSRQGLIFQAHLLSATMAHGKPTLFCKCLACAVQDLSALDHCPYTLSHSSTRGAEQA